MVFSSVPVYLDPPNWHQANNQLSGSTNNSITNEQNPGQLAQPLPPPATGNAGSIRPTSMADRARMAKLPQPETALKCPRCDSTNTKFCYFNNYSLTQPRHFCKTCRRYWTRGGALRNVPVGGGCRRNKRSKGSNSSSNSNSSSKSPVAGNHERHQAAGSSSTSSSIPSSSCNSAGDHMLLGHITHHPMPQSHLPFMASLHHHLTDHHHYGAAHDQMGLSFCGIQQTSGGSGKTSNHDLDFQMGISTSSGGGSSNVLSSGAHEQWRLQQQVQQFPFLAGLEPPPGLYPFDQEGVEPGGGYGGGGVVGQIRVNKQPTSSMPILHGSLQGAVKMEENQGLNLPVRPFLGINPGSDQFLGGNAWTDLSGFTSSSTSHLL